MLIVVKLIFVAIAVFGQSKLFPEKEAPTESEFETIALPADHPELALARRALAAEGLCRSSAAEKVTPPEPTAAGPGLPPASDSGLAANLSESCF